jgi:hypothetical protein
MDREPDFFGDVLKVALGIFLGGVLLWAAAEYRARYLAAQSLAQIESSASQLALANAQREIERRALVRERERVIREQQDAAVSAAAAERHKEAAWRAFYQPSAECVANTSVECGNAHIRARREFERQYRVGR